jgi:hypothetical protein
VEFTIVDENKLSLDFDPNKFIRLDTPPITAEQIAELERDLQVGLPPGWQIRALVERHGDHHQLIGYEMQAGFDMFTISTRGQGPLPPGWRVRVTGGAFYDEFIVTAPDGTAALISDILLA